MSIQKPESCKSCLGWNWGCGGFVPASGSGSNGVLIVAEAAGENEAAEGAPLVGKAGYYFFQQLGRVGIERDGFRIHNVLSCRPPENKLAGMPYEAQVIASCSPNLDQTIRQMRSSPLQVGRTFVILTLGRVAFKRIMDLTDKSPLMHEDYLVYPHWSERYGAWVLACDHPSYLMRGNHHLAPVLQFTAKRALEIAENGLTLEQPVNYVLDPEPVHFAGWAAEYLANPHKFVLSYDIETPYKQGEDEEKIAREDNDDYTIIRCSFCYRPGHAVSVPWTAPYMATIQALFGSPGPKVGWNSRGYDDERILSKMPINGDRLDAMLAWHVLNSALPKGLAFVTPFYWQNTGMWKQLSQQNPAFYNAKDADAALRCWHGIEKDLKLNHQWNVFQRHVINLNRVLDYMSARGVLRDEALRSSAEERLTNLLNECEAKIQAEVPEKARRIAHVYKTTPKDITGLLSRDGSRHVPTCPGCGVERPRKDHFKVYKKKANPCAGLQAEGIVKTVTEYYRLAEWKISKVGLMDYQRVKRHQPVFDRRTKKLTFDETALIKLMKRYPHDQLYPLVIDFRGNQKLLSTYIGVTDLVSGRVRGGMAIGPDGRIHTQFTTDASTLRSTSRNPNLQNLPRPKGVDDLATIIRNLIIPAAGHIFTARDYSGIEAVLVGYEAQAANYIRLAKLDVHSFYTAYALHELDGSVSSSDLPDASWPDEKLIPCLAGLKKRLKEPRNSLYKHLVHGANFFQGAKGAAEKILNETGKAFPVELVQKVMDIYFALFPEIKKWHREEMMRAERDGFTRNAFGYVHRWSQVYEYEPDGDGGWTKQPGPQANQVIAFKPQSNAAGIIKEAMMRLYYNRFEEAGQYLRLLVHDELFLEVPENDQQAIDKVVQEEMEKPIPELALPAAWGMGDALTINTEAKAGHRWGQMH